MLSFACSKLLQSNPIYLRSHQLEQTGEQNPFK